MHLKMYTKKPILKIQHSKLNSVLKIYYWGTRSNDKHIILKIRNHNLHQRLLKVLNVNINFLIWSLCLHCVYVQNVKTIMTLKFRFIILSIHISVMWDWHYSMQYSWIFPTFRLTVEKIREYYMDYCRSHGTLLRIWIILCLWWVWHFYYWKSHMGCMKHILPQVGKAKIINTKDNLVYKIIPRSFALNKIVPTIGDDGLWLTNLWASFFENLIFNWKNITFIYTKRLR